MDADKPLYNSRLFKIYLEYIKKEYPDLAVEEILQYAKMTLYEVEDKGHWFNQKQVNRFNKILAAKTKNPRISQDVGRYAASSKGMSFVKQFVLGMVNPATAYLLLDKSYKLLSRAAIIKTKKCGSSKIEIIVKPRPGVNEKPHQCLNRTGIFEALAKYFTQNYAKVEHPKCIHRGDASCKYIITWDKTPSIIFKKIRNWLLLTEILFIIPLIIFLPYFTAISSIFGITALIFLLDHFAASTEKKELKETISSQGQAAKENLQEISLRYHNAMLVQKVGQASASIFEVKQLAKTVLANIAKHLGFDNALIMMPNPNKTSLIYTAQYGANPILKKFLKQLRIPLNKKSAPFRIFSLVFIRKKPLIINNIDKIKSKLPDAAYKIMIKNRLKSYICVPIIYKKRALGIMIVSNQGTLRRFTESEINLLQGITSHIAVSIINARTFQKLHESRERYRNLYENSPHAYFTISAVSELILDSNPMAANLTGYTREELNGSKFIRLIDDSYQNTAKIKEIRATFFKKKSLHDMELQIQQKDGSPIWISLSLEPIFDNHSNLVEGRVLMIDISGRKGLENRLRHAQKMEAIGTLAGGVAHDLNNILSGVVSYPELLLFDLDPASPFSDPLKKIKKSGEKAAAVVQDLLTLARRGVAVKEVVNLNSIMIDYLKSPEYENLLSLHPRIEVETDINYDLLNIIGSPVHLSKIIMNLISNAAEAMPTGGLVKLITHNQYIDCPKDGTAFLPEGDYVVLIVADQGFGIAKEDLERIYDPFYTKKKMGRSGTGLGMAVVWGSVKDHNGHIEVSSKLNKGTTFTIYIPATRESLTKESPTEEPDYMGNGETVLIVDDMQEQMEIASNMLRKLGYSVSSVSSGEKAVEYVAKYSPDMVVLDMIMEPGMDGLSTYKKILNFHPEQKAIITSGYSESSRVKEALRLGAGTYIRKPYMLKKLGKALHDEFARQPQTNKKDQIKQC